MQLNVSLIVFKILFHHKTLLVLVALAACAFAMEAQDQESAEQSYRIHGVYPAWYQYGVAAFNGVRAFPAYAGSPGYRLNANRVDDSAASYPSDFFVGVRNVAHPYAIEAAAENQYSAATYSNGFRGYPFAGYPYTGYPITGYPSAVYPAAAASTVVKNVAYPYGYGYNTFQYGTYGAVPYVEPYVAPPHTSARRAAAPAKA